MLQVAVLLTALSRPALVAPRPPAPLRSRAPVATAPAPASLLGKAARMVRGDPTIQYETITCSDIDEEECLALCDEETGCSIVAPSAALRTLKIGVYFALWFALSTGYNIANKVRLNAIALPWCHSAASLGVGSAFVSFLWATGLRKRPSLPRAAVATLLPISFLHALGHIGAVVSAGAGAVSFTQIVKAAEPVCTALLSWGILGATISAPAALALVPIVAGVALASVSELSFTWLSFSGAMLSNLAFATRNILSRASMDRPKGKNMTPENLFGVLTVMSFLWALPCAILIEGPTALAKWSAATAVKPASYILQYTVSTGLYFYLYNEVAMLALNNVNPVTHAVANTLKRVVILLACVVFFKTPMTPLCIAGSTVAIVGSYLYSMAKGREKALAKAAAKKGAA
ncbi:hypothetical protein EMIHUDRAFT_438986 [Emiliania huxleyi CCMP1516]|uniref:Sugar phosphate transporter domain-containing protein n=2 Tax=Emiliania huxleyi TaxID=2903 RepID=A0A0D3I1H6_EMIH1|nr:hypothetical protein EMIHUDRAFT_438986 [Emiliania huxleyi CCMP1516]EOD05111.1 hypothetical protein EMIHUDRAFT_438986 [Emiliania huxleyi CCMP1516]|eukprot:XP_005757540.1 hypothetical protein EMIHUDRAFT_438986 [Emiliania huxleyi CCMP1516]